MKKPPTQDTATLDPAGGDDKDRGYKPSLWSVEVLYGPGMAGRSLSGGSSSWMQQRNETEKASWSQSAGLRANYQLSPYWKLSTGVVYSQRGEQFSTTLESERMDTMIQSSEIVIYHPVNPPRTVTIYDTTVTTQYISQDLSSSNVYRQLSIPLELERSFYIRDRWTLMVRPGVQFSVWSTGKGLMLDESGQVAAIEELPVKSAGVVNLSIGAGSAYRMNDKVSLLVYPRLTYGINSTMGNEFQLTQQEYGMFVQFGMRIDL